MSKKDRRRQHSRTTGKTRRATDPGTVYTSTVDAEEAKPWRDRVGSDMQTQVGFTDPGYTPVLFLMPTHELHLFADDGTTSTNAWTESLSAARFHQVTELHRLDEVAVDADWTVQLGPASHHPGDPRFLTLNGVVRGPSSTGTERDLFYQGQINTSGEWLEQAQRHNKLLLVATARDGAEYWAAAAHLNRPTTH